MSRLSKLEVIETGSRRRWSLEEKRRILAESLAVPRNVSATARRYGLSASQLFGWRRLAREGKLALDDDAGFVPVVVGPDTAVPAAPTQCKPAMAAEWSAPAALSGSGRIEIVLSHPRRLILEGDVDAVAMARIVTALERT
jgi:transposase